MPCQSLPGTPVQEHRVVRSLPGTPLQKYRALRPTDESILKRSQRKTACVSRQYQMPSHAVRGLADSARSRLVSDAAGRSGASPTRREGSPSSPRSLSSPTRWVGSSSLSRADVANTYCQPQSGMPRQSSTCVFHEDEPQGCPEAKDDCASDAKSDSISTTDISERTSISTYMDAELKKLSERIYGESVARESAFTKVLQLLQTKGGLCEHGCEKLKSHCVTKMNDEATLHSVIEKEVQSQVSAFKNEIRSTIQLLTCQQEALSNTMTLVRDDLNRFEASVDLAVEDQIVSHVAPLQNDLSFLKVSLDQASDVFSRKVDMYWRETSYTQKNLAQRLEQLDRIIHPLDGLRTHQESPRSHPHNKITKNQAHQDRITPMNTADVSVEHFTDEQGPLVSDTESQVASSRCHTQSPRSPGGNGGALGAMAECHTQSPRIPGGNGWALGAKAECHTQSPGSMSLATIREESPTGAVYEGDS